MSKDTPSTFSQPRHPSILVGDLRVFEPRNGKVLITVEHGTQAGEAVSIDAAELQLLLEDFYTQNF